MARSLRSPSSGLRGQGVRFALAGGTVALVYLSTTSVLAEVVGMPFQVALAIGFTVALIVHFTLQRVFVWRNHEEFALPLHQQAGRYLILAGVQYGVTAASTSLLPAALGVSSEIVYLATVAVVLGANFTVFRHGIFHAKPTPPERDQNVVSYTGEGEDGAGAGEAGRNRRRTRRM
jgi:putative flippase GtrA